MRLTRLPPSLTVNAASLMTATIGTNLLGLCFWAEAAHLKAPAIVGRAAATVAALTLLATVAQLNLTNVFIRLLPEAGRLSTGFIRRGYLVVIALALGVGALYVATGLSTHVLAGSLAGRVLFVLAVAVVALFALQDSILTALRLAPWVAVEDISFGASKLALLPLTVLLPLGGGIVISWVVPAGVAVVGVNLLLFRRVLPKLGSVEGTLPVRQRLLSFVAGEYAGNLCATATIQLMPLLVIWRLGAAQVGYFTLPWLISMGITGLLWNVAASFVVEVISGPGDASPMLRRILLLWGGIALAALVVCVLGAHPLLELMGPGYATHGAALLRLVGLSVPFAAVVALYSTLAWLDQRVWLLAGLQAAIGVAVLGATLALLAPLGLVAVGWANLGTQALAAAVMGPLALCRLRRGQLEPTR